MNDETIHVTAEEKADYDNKYTSTDLNSDVDAFMKSNSWDNFNTGIDTINANILSIIDTNKKAYVSLSYTSNEIGKLISDNKDASI